MTTTKAPRWSAADSAYRRRFEAALNGEPADRLSASAWQHFPGFEYDPEALASAIAASVLRHDWDWVKINPRGIYYAEIWGARYDPEDYGGGELPRLVKPAWRSLEDLKQVTPRPDSPVIAEQAELQRQLRELLPDRPLLYTVFSPLSVLLQGLALPLYAGGESFGAAPEVRIDELWGADPAVLHGALEAITETLVALTEELLSAGADGLFYAVTGTANPQISADREWFAQFSTPYDQQVLNAAKDGVNVLHTCGPESHPEWFTHWPVDALHWDSFADGNPGLGEIPAAVGGGVDHRQFDGDHDEELEAAVAVAKAATGGRPFLLAPTCTVVSGNLNEDSLALLARAAAR